MIEITIKIRSPLNDTYSKRVKLYHGITILVSIALPGGLALGNATGKSNINTCFIKMNSVGNLILFISTSLYIFMYLVLVVKFLYIF